MVPFRRESFNSSLPSLASLSESERSEISLYDEVIQAQKNSRFSCVGKRRKRVSFSEYSMGRMIPNIESYSREELEAMYLTDEDMERINEENIRTIQEIQKGNLPDTETDYFRGLEGRANAHLCKQKRALREITVSLILSEQEVCNEICPDWIEHVYSKITEDSVAMANTMAAVDAESVFNDITVAFTTIKSKFHIDCTLKVDATSQ